MEDPLGIDSRSVFLSYYGQVFCGVVPKDASDDSILNLAITKFKERAGYLRETFEFDFEGDCRRFRPILRTGQQEEVLQIVYEFVVCRAEHRWYVCTRAIW